MDDLRRGRSDIHVDDDHDRLSHIIFYLLELYVGHGLPGGRGGRKHQHRVAAGRVKLLQLITSIPIYHYLHYIAPKLEVFDGDLHLMRPIATDDPVALCVCLLCTCAVKKGSTGRGRVWGESCGTRYIA